MSKRRDEYLEKHWLKYPEMPRGALRYGRSEQMRIGTQNLTEWTFKDAPEIKAGDVLLDGDLLALMPSNQLVMLAANRTDRKPKFDKWPEQKKWFYFLTLVRTFFKEKRFQDVKTATLVICPGTEPTIEVFETEFSLGSKKIKFFLTTSPELNLKKLLTEGAERIFEIASVFRDGELTDKHHPEFTMLEWYRAFSNFSAVKMDMIELVEYLSDQMKVDRPLEVLTFSIPDLFLKHCQFELKPSTTEDELKALAVKLNVDVSSAQTMDDYFYLIFMEKIEFQWPSDRLVFIEKYPPYQAALARIGSDGWAERFEVYWNGLELANAFHELNNPDIQRQRAADDLVKKKLSGKKEITLDADFFTALDYGLPPSSGIAVGLERLFMAMHRMNNIKQVIK